MKQRGIHAHTRAKMLKIFESLYPDPKSERHFTNDYELIVSVILSAQCTDKKVNQVTPELFKQYASFTALGSARISDIEKIIRPINYYKSKAKSLILMAKAVTTEHGAALPQTRPQLEALAGVGRKTASVILSEKGIEPALAVDTHVFRVSQRLGLAHSNNRETVELQLREQFDPSLWRNLHHWLILHGRRICKAQNPACQSCALSTLCPSVEVTQAPQTDLH